MLKSKLRRISERGIAQGFAFLLVLIYCSTFAPRAAGQTSLASVIGTITDSSGGVVPGATVVLVNSETGATRTGH